MIAVSKARLDGVRFVPELRDRSGSASSARRPVYAGAVSSGSVFKRRDSMFAYRFFADAALKMHPVQRQVNDYFFGLPAPELPLPAFPFPPLPAGGVPKLPRGP
ncbi:hypothetical protein [Novosphingobium arvoryzae]|uniref:Uncharacterized protein n=1 Tax=Novosphingobium arvoryzae TaxID=1256514 RepID=A0A918VI16_9SPHN|nr:hypothetical protein [Novosphingobium arvoryzae]GGZ98314.1 hypothetical protein GCM10011617_18220 [Novosphingobium arvoryzae]